MNFGHKVPDDRRTLRQYSLPQEGSNRETWVGRGEGQVTGSGSSCVETVAHLFTRPSTPDPQGPFVSLGTPSFVSKLEFRGEVNELASSKVSWSGMD